MNVVDKSITKRLVFLVEAREGLGLGHLRRSMIARNALDKAGYQTSFYALCDEYPTGVPIDLGFGGAATLLPFSDTGQLETLLEYEPDCLVVDLARYEPSLIEVLGRYRARKIHLLAIGSRAWRHFDFDGVYVPGFYVSKEARERYSGALSVGWGNALIPSLKSAEHKARPEKILVLTGGDDPTGENQHLPQRLEALVSPDISFTLVQGPRAAPFDISGCKVPERFEILRPSGPIADQFHQYDAAVAFFGLSVLELLASDVPSLVSDPHGALPGDGWHQLLENELVLDGRTPEAFAQNFEKLLAGWRPSIQTSKLFKPEGAGFVDFANSLLADPSSVEHRKELA